MPSGTPGQPQGQGRQSGGSVQGARDKAQNIGQQMQQGAEQVGQRLREGVDSAREEVVRRHRRAEGMVARNPAPSVLMGFGIGFGLGLVLTTLLSQKDETWADRHVPDSLRNLPDSFHQMADTLRGLPDAIARHVPSSLTRR